MKNLLNLVLVFTYFSISSGQKEGDSCKLENNRRGKCTKISECEKALKELDESGKWPTICKYEDFLPIVCCDKVADLPIIFTRSSVAVTEKFVPTSTEGREPGVKFGEIAAKKCKEYSEWKINEPPVLAATADKLNLGRCKISTTKLIVGGEKAKPGEFGHMVRVGFSEADDQVSISWSCGGSLISDDFVMTAGHCTRNRDGLNANFVLFNDVDNKKPTRRKVVSRLRHPSYKPPQTYNDIALLKLDRPVRFNDYLRPACLSVRNDNDLPAGIATGWGTTSYRGQASEDLLKVELPFLSYENCSKTYTTKNGGLSLPHGLNNNSMICAGGIETGKDTCQGDSGGPIQIVLEEPKCMYSIVGVTSFGKNCGLVPGVYTRVSNYVTWIESVVWPSG